MNSILGAAIQRAQQSEVIFTKFITPNDTGATGSHQAGFHLHKNTWSFFFDEAGVKGENKDRYITIRWQDDFETTSRIIYYGVRTRNEYRLTRFGRGFPYLTDNNVGDLLVLCRSNAEFYHAYVLQSDEEIEDFLAALNISSTETNKLISRRTEENPEMSLLQCFMEYLQSLNVNFPTTAELARQARDCYNTAYKVNSKRIAKHPDAGLLNWLDAEFSLFKTIENDRYSSRIRTPFESVEELVETANTILNRRKSRAGKSLEHHLSEIFQIYSLRFEIQVVTEDNKKPDFLFPGREAYINPRFDENKLVFLASKTTCKDRWRQVLNEADRIRVKHLFTLQQSISKNQLEEMYKYDVCLVVPKPYLTSFPKEFQGKILTVESFVSRVRSVQS